MAKTVFITGTDTGIGKTYVACHILRAAREHGLKVAGFKPVASGCERTPQGLRNEDALALREAAGDDRPYAQTNPYALEPAVAPHLAAAEAGVQIDLEHIVACYEKQCAGVDLVVVEGAGGWAVPLGPELAFADLVMRMDWPVLLVVGMRLGCLNHAQLSAESISRRSKLVGWVANCLPPQQPRLDENIAWLQRELPASCLGSTGGEQSGPHNLDFDALYQAL